MTNNSSDDSAARKPALEWGDIESRIGQNYPKEMEAERSLPKSFESGEGVVFAPDELDSHADVAEVEKGGSGSGSWEGPGQPRFAHAPAGGFKLRASNPDAYEFNVKDPVRTKDLSGRVVSKFSITPSGEFAPVSEGQMHASVLKPGEYDESVRVIQDPKRKLAFMHFGGASKQEIESAISGDEKVWASVRERQREIADKLYRRHPGTKVILASGGPGGTRSGSRTGFVDSPSDIPDMPENFIDPKYVHTV